MRSLGKGLAAISIAAASLVAHATVTIDYTADAVTSGGDVAGLSARATFELSGTTLDILLQNTSTGAPMGFEAADALLVSLALDLPTTFASGDLAQIATGSAGFGAWSTLVAGASVADEWLWGNGGAGDYLANFNQVITTSNGLGGGSGSAAHFTGGGTGTVNGPSGGIAANPHTVSPGGLFGAQDTLFFRLTLAQTISESELESAAKAGVVEFGSDARYLTTPEPASVVFMALVGLALLRRR